MPPVSAADPPVCQPAQVTVVICTLGRMETLPQCLEALGRQTLPPGEIVAVLGPAPKAAAAFLRSRANVRVVRTDAMNVSRARNIGVRAARGRLIAFCDDDAICHPDWLEQLVRPFNDERVGAAGGTVLEGDPERPHVVFANGLVRLSGRQVNVRPRPGEHNVPAGPWYNNVRGCNCAMSRVALERVGGFDEFIEFSYEESDVCVRMIRAGLEVAHVPQAIVHHRPVPGGRRQDELIRDWRCEIKNQLYFGLGNSLNGLTTTRTILRVLLRMTRLWLRFAVAEATGTLSAGQGWLFRRQSLLGFRQGLRAGLARRRR